MPLFTDDEMKAPLCIKIVKLPAGNPDGTHIEFYGRVTTAAMNEIWPHMSAVDRRFLEEPINTGSDLFQSLQIIFNTWAYVHQGGQPAPNAIMHLYNPMSRVPGHGKGICQACGVELEMGMPFESDKLLFERGKYAKCIDKPKTGE